MNSVPPPLSDSSGKAWEESEHTRLLAWQRARDYFDAERMAAAREAILDIRQDVSVREALRRHPARDAFLSKDYLVRAYQLMVREGALAEDNALLAKLRMKPVRSQSGVATVTVLTAPHPCPGRCIFCPDDARMPKSYLVDEPGALRAGQHMFRPGNQVRSRLESLEAIGHPTGKIELLILGGTWDAYPPEYREEFVRRCFDALNGRESETLSEAQRWNETARRRNVGLVVETRPDAITPASLLAMRRLGVTKVQVGLQSLDDEILRRNARGHTVADSRRALRLLRAAGLKIHAHWMPNLLGATPESDREDFARLWSDLDLRPDELKIYPTILIRGTALYEHYESGAYHPYAHTALVELMAAIKPTIPPYCRVNRLARDIPAHHVAAGSTRSNLREDAQRLLEERGERCRCIRCREVRGRLLRREDLKLEEMSYEAGGAREVFLSFVTADDRLAGFLRLSLPGLGSPPLGWPDLENAAIIREVHIYGQMLPVGAGAEGASQHIGLGTELLTRAGTLACEAGFRRLAVISAVGTRPYYRDRGFTDGELYQIKDISA
jgi:elongator complex protein 3